MEGNANPKSLEVKFFFKRLRNVSADLTRQNKCERKNRKHCSFNFTVQKPLLEFKASFDEKTGFSVAMLSQKDEFHLKKSN